MSNTNIKQQNDKVIQQADQALQGQAVIPGKRASLLLQIQIRNINKEVQNLIGRFNRNEGMNFQNKNKNKNYNNNHDYMNENQQLFHKDYNGSNHNQFNTFKQLKYQKKGKNFKQSQKHQKQMKNKNESQQPPINKFNYYGKYRFQQKQRQLQIQQPSFHNLNKTQNYIKNQQKDFKDFRDFNDMPRIQQAASILTQPKLQKDIKKDQSILAHHQSLLNDNQIIQYPSNYYYLYFDKNKAQRQKTKQKQKQKQFQKQQNLSKKFNDNNLFKKINKNYLDQDFPFKQNSQKRKNQITQHKPNWILQRKIQTLQKQVRQLKQQAQTQKDFMRKTDHPIRLKKGVQKMIQTLWP